MLAVRELADAAHAGGATVVVDNTLASPLRQRPLDLGADVSVTSASKHLSGHSDVVLGVVAVREAERADALRALAGQTGAIPGPFETWLAHRSLATLAVRLERQEANARAIADALRARDDVDRRALARGRLGGRASTSGSAARADAMLAACEIVAQATSFGGVHSNAERRARWGTDAVARGLHPAQRGHRGRRRPGGRPRARALAQPTLNAVPHSRQAAFGPGLLSVRDAPTTRTLRPLASITNWNRPSALESIWIG